MRDHLLKTSKATGGVAEFVPSYLSKTALLFGVFFCLFFFSRCEFVCSFCETKDGTKTQEEGEIVSCDTFANTRISDLLAKAYAKDSLVQDDHGGLYYPREYVILYDSIAPDSDRTFMRDSVLKAVSTTYCPCDSNLVLYTLAIDDPRLQPGGGMFFSEIEGEPIKSKSCIESYGVNYLIYDKDTSEGLDFSTEALTTKISQMPYNSELNNEAIKIAVLDTGIDYDHDELKEVIWINEPELALANPTGQTDLILDGVDNDGNEIIDDYLGYNFVKLNNNPNDDNGHGTHVAGIIHQSLQKFEIPTYAYRLMAIKTHDEKGGGSLFSAACGALYAEKMGADIVNMSWGWYGLSAPYMNKIIERTGRESDMIYVLSAGNENKHLVDDLPKHYPTAFDRDNCVTVGALGTDEEGGLVKEARSNYGSAVDIMAMGENITSTFPSNTTATFSGTSMAAPVVSARLAKKKWTSEPREEVYYRLKKIIFDEATTIPRLDTIVEGARVLNTGS